ncbi:hypothetical protein K503DRAFT_860847 [Rhizopogon vinicolor AM-OR11-026]|uniref:Thiaminase-2/PQQC domain-containing protein n=1 Tax=Rhizopogon vinicolor AM-OR11-026 TaxID=1314800 RepID=A0A1B7MF15_9AGAM|nr:hypothetical protein K503DRAFT_860847 [Rhizopogon vinicolor AM-OR11-026]
MQANQNEPIPTHKFPYTEYKDNLEGVCSTRVCGTAGQGYPSKGGFLCHAREWSDRLSTSVGLLPSRLLAAKSHAYAPILAATEVVFHIVRESSMHYPESPALTAYRAFLIDIGMQTVTLAACLLGSGKVGLWLKEEARAPNSWVRWDDNPYLKWMEDYSGDEYQKAVKVGLETLESRAAADMPSLVSFTEWRDVGERCTRLEKGFWDMAMMSKHICGAHTYQ